MRLFVALPIPDPVAQPLMLLQGGVPGARWQQREQLHLTLRFIGEVNGADARALDDYTERALARVWKAQHFSYWMTTMLHRQPETSDFDERRQLSELESLVASPHGAAYLAEGYTGWPSG